MPKVVTIRRLLRVRPSCHSGRIRQAWAACARGAALGNELVFLLKFMSFSRRVLYLLSILASGASSSHSYSREALRGGSGL